MNKEQFLSELGGRLSGLPQGDIDERLGFYAEMIDDRMEDGFTEDEAVAEIGSIDDIVSRILEEYPLSVIMKEKVKPKRRIAAWEVILLILGSPVWIPVLLILFACFLLVYVCLIAVIISVWAVDAALLGGFLFSILLFVSCIMEQNIIFALLSIFAGLICAGLSIFMFFACKSVTKGCFRFTKKFVLWVKSKFVGKERRK